MTTHLEALLARLQAEAKLSEDTVAEIRVAAASDAAVTPTTHAGWRKVAAEIVAYLGAALVVVAIILIIADRWAMWGSAVRQGVLVAVAAALLIAAAVTGSATPTRRRLAGVLGAVAIVPAAAWPAVGLIDPWDKRVWPLVAVLVATWSYSRARTLIGHVALVVSIAIVPVIWTGLFAIPRETTIIGACFVLIGFGWLVVSELGYVGESEIAAVAGAGLALLGSQVPVLESPDYPGYAAAAAISGMLIYAYLRWQRRIPVLAAGVIGLGIVSGEVVNDLTGGDVFGAAMGMLVAGAVMLIVAIRIVRSTKHEE